MPAVYRSRYEEIERLSAEIQGMDRMGRLLWEQGVALRDVVGEAFAAFKSKPSLSDDGACLMVRLDPNRRVLVLVATADGPLAKNSESVAGAFKLLQTTAGTGDRVVLVTTGDRRSPPSGENRHRCSRRPGTVAPDGREHPAGDDTLQRLDAVADRPERSAGLPRAASCTGRRHLQGEDRQVVPGLAARLAALW